jgi:hypothetical protein
MPKIKMKIVEIRPETNPKTGRVLYRVFVESNGKVYPFGVRETDYLNETRRKSVHRAWLKTIREDQTPVDPENIIDPKAIREAILGTEIEEDPYDKK